MSREVLNPPIQRMSNNRCYRVNLVHEDFGNMQQRQTTTGGGDNQQKGYVEKDLYGVDDDDDEEDAEQNNIVEQANGTYVLAMHVAPAFHGGLIGFKGTTKKRLESETQTSIQVPPRAAGPHKKNETVTIKGKSRSDVNAARRKIKLLTSSLRMKTKATHFIGIPLNSGEIRENFAKFKTEVLAANYPGIDESLWQSEGALHLTICACVLLDDVERSKAIQLLDDCRSLLDGLQTPLDITVAGLEIMNDDPSAVQVLYARVEAPVLQQFANRIEKHFFQNGLCKDKRESVKLHMTLLNNRYRKQENAQSPNNFDARELLKRFADYRFGNAKCNMIALHMLGSRQEDEYYKMTGTLQF